MSLSSLTLFLNCMPACWFETSLHNFEVNISAAKTWNILGFNFNFSNSMIRKDFLQKQMSSRDPWNAVVLAALQNPLTVAPLRGTAEAAGAWRGRGAGGGRGFGARGRTGPSKGARATWGTGVGGGRGTRGGAGIGGGATERKERKKPSWNLRSENEKPFNVRKWKNKKNQNMMNLKTGAN